MRRLGIIVPCAAAVGAAVAFWARGSAYVFPLDILWELLTGWAAYAQDVLPRKGASGTGMAAALGLAALLTACVHLLCARVHRAPEPWRPRWTALCVGFLLALLAAGAAAVGVGRQIAALARDETPLYALPDRAAGFDSRGLLNYVASLWDQAQAGDWRAADVRRMIQLQSTDGWRPNSHYHLLAFNGPDGRLALILLFDRDPAVRSRRGLAVVSAEGARMEPSESLSGLLPISQPTANQPATRPSTQPATHPATPNKGCNS